MNDQLISETWSSEMTPEVIWVENSETFSKLAETWLNYDFLAIDTEFERRTTYYPILALVQVYDGNNIYLIDPLKLECPDAFRQLCADQTIIKIMHSAREDLEVFYYSWGCQLKGLFDTQLAFAFVNGEMSKGYASLVECLCQHRLDKQATQSDWMKRPLSAKQLDYAAKDVIYLPAIYTMLNQKLKVLAFNHLFKSECDELCQLVTQLPDYELDYRMAKDVWRLNRTQLSLFKKLYQWREETAITEDKTKNHILRDPQLVQVAILQPQTKTALHRIADFHPRSFRLYWQELVELIVEFNQKPDIEQSCIPNPRDIKNLNQLSELLFAYVNSEADKLGFVAGLLASKRIVKKIVFAKLTNEAYPSVWFGWRGKILKPAFAIIYSQFSSANLS